MNKQQAAYNEGYKLALRTIAAKEETTDYSVQQSKMMLGDMSETAKQILDLSKKIQDLSETLTQQWSKVIKVMSASPDNEDRNSPANQLFQQLNPLDAVIRGATGSYITYHAEKITEEAQTVSDAIEKTS